MMAAEKFSEDDENYYEILGCDEQSTVSKSCQLGKKRVLDLGTAPHLYWQSILY